MVSDTSGICSDRVRDDAPGPKQMPARCESSGSTERRRSQYPCGVNRPPSQALSDVAIRSALRTRLLREHHHESDMVLVEELGLCRGTVRADLAVVNGSIHGYEIKSDRDSVRRLTSQALTYGRVFDRATLVVGDRFLSAAELLPAWWGILHARQTPDGLKFRTVRKARLNRQKDPRAIVELLWSEQALALLERRGLDRGVRSKARRFLWDRLCAELSVREISDAVRAHLKTSRGNPTHREP